MHLAITPPVAWLFAAIAVSLVALELFIIWRLEKRKNASRKLVDSLRESFRYALGKEVSTPKTPPKDIPFEPVSNIDKDDEKRIADALRTRHVRINTASAWQQPKKPPIVDFPPVQHINVTTLTEQQKIIVNQVTHAEKSILQGNAFTASYLNYQSKTGFDLIKTISDKGTRGEFQTFSLLEKHFSRDYLFSDVYLRFKNGTTSQIDVILLTPSEIYIIENKNYTGSVYGSENKANWSHYVNGKDYPFQNPIIQNKGHCDAFKGIFPQIPGNRIVSVVVYNNLCKLKVTTKTPVISRNQLIDLIQSRQTKREAYFPDSELQLISKILLYHSIQNDDIKQQHIKYATAQKDKAIQ